MKFRETIRRYSLPKAMTLGSPEKIRISVPGTRNAISVQHQHHQRCGANCRIDGMPDSIRTASTKVLTDHGRNGKTECHHRQEKCLHHACADSETRLCRRTKTSDMTPGKCSRSWESSRRVRGGASAKQEFSAPRTETEVALAEIWAKLLRVDKVGVHDNFFDLGGHSLLATQMLSNVQATFEVELPMLSLFERPTLLAWPRLSTRSAV